MLQKYRVKPIFDHHRDIKYSKMYVLQKLGPLGWLWWTISEPTDDKEKIMKDCEEAQEFYNKYNNW